MNVNDLTTELASAENFMHTRGYAAYAQIIAAGRVAGTQTDDAAAVVREVGIALAGQVRPERTWATDSNATEDMYDQVWDKIAQDRTPRGLESAMAVCDVLASRGALPALRLAIGGGHIAVAQIHPLADALQLFRSSPRSLTDSWTVLLHEYIARDGDVIADAAASEYLDRVRDSGHPLGALPTELLSCEKSPFSEAVGAVPNENSFAELLPTFAQAEVEATERQRRALIAPFEIRLEADMNSQAEGYYISFEKPIAPDAVTGRNLHALSIPPMSGPTPPTVRRVEFSDVCRIQHGSAALGGAYGDRLGAAYGRLASWRSIGALADCWDKELDVANIRQLAEQCHWYLFDGTSWFHSYITMWNVGIAALHPRGYTMSVVAATDTD